MKRSGMLSVLILLLLSFLPSTVLAVNGFQNWEPNVGGELEFGITSLVSAIEENAPWVFEGGYNGAMWFNKDSTIGQTFTVTSDRLLQSVSTRINAWNDAVGQFEIAIYEFDQASQSTTNRLAFVNGDADSYRYALSSVPVSTFDMSGFNANLAAGQTYMLTFRGKESSAGTFSVQGSTNIYNEGSAYQGTYTASGPDLTGTWTSQSAGRKIKGSLLIENIGSEPAAENFTMAVYLSDDGHTPGSLLYSKILSAKHGETDVTPRTLKIKEHSSSGKYIIALIDSGNDIAETDEDNNIIILQSP